jgi:hypothetical protein
VRAAELELPQSVRGADLQAEHMYLGHFPLPENGFNESSPWS